MATKWEIGNDLRNICDRLFEIEKEQCPDDLLLAKGVIRTCRLAIGHLSNKMCADDVLVPSNREMFVEIAQLSTHTQAYCASGDN
jgi:hypothetical protein